MNFFNIIEVILDFIENEKNLREKIWKGSLLNFGAFSNLNLFFEKN